MIQWSYFPRNMKSPTHITDLVNVFERNKKYIESETNQLRSDDVLEKLRLNLENLGYSVEKGKRKADKIRIPVLYGAQGKETLSFEVDAYHAASKTVVEVEAGRAFTNYQFLKDFFEACMMLDVEYFCVAVRLTYNNHNDYKSVCDFFDAFYASNRVTIPLQGILVIGY